MLLKLRCDEFLPGFAFNFNLRRYNTSHRCTSGRRRSVTWSGGASRQHPNPC
jgi:hypothetical protein